MDKFTSDELDDFKIALLLRGTRNLLGWNLKEMGDCLEVAPSTVGKWENNDLTLKASTFIKLLSLLEKEGISIDLSNEKSELVIRVKPEFVKRVATNKHSKGGKKEEA